MTPNRFQLLLPFLAALGDTPRPIAAICDDLAGKHARSDHDKVQYEGRWAGSTLARSGFADRPRRGLYKLNAVGKDLLRQGPNVAELRQIVGARYEPSH